eukprot:19597-Heterococcus_DN1.PRE.2
MFRKPLLRPGVKDACSPASCMNSGFTCCIASAELPLRPRMSTERRPIVSCASESPSKYTLSFLTEADTCTVLRQPCTLFSGVFSAAGSSLPCEAMNSSCL